VRALDRVELAGVPLRDWLRYTIPMANERSIKRLLVVLPNWVGDVVMATPVLAAMRDRFAAARIDYLARPYVSDLLDGCGWSEQVIPWPKSSSVSSVPALVGLSRKLKSNRYDAAVLLTNSFRSGLVAWLAGIPRRVGYDRDGRGALLTDRLRPLRSGGDYVPVPMVPYYAALAERIGCPVPDQKLRLGISPEQEAEGQRLLEHYSLEPGRYGVINPGAAFGAAKCWLPERFAQVCDRLRSDLQWMPVLVGAPRERDLLERIASACQTKPVWCMDPGTTLGSLKVIIREAAVLICNDTGPRHYGNAFDTPTVTVFGPTYREWTDCHYEQEINLQALVTCGPCQLKRCPLDLECMRAITADRVMEAVGRLLPAAQRPVQNWQAAC
jgi:heptosyltransferase-2